MEAQPGSSNRNHRGFYIVKPRLFSKAALFLSAAVAIASALPALGQTPPAEQLLPDNTMVAATIKDWSATADYFKKSPNGMLWNDSSLKPFRDHFLAKLNTEVIAPLERELGVKLADYQELLRGQLTVALTDPKPGTTESGFILLMDSKDKSDLLKTKLAELQKKWRDSGKQLKEEKIRDVDFSIVTISKKDVRGLLEKVFPNKAEEEADDEEEKDKTGKAGSFELHIGQSKSLLIVGDDQALIEKTLARQNGGLLKPLADQPAFQKNYTAFFRDGLGFVYVRFGPIYDAIAKSFTPPPSAEGDEPNPFKPDKILPALGFKGLESVGLTFSGGPDGDRGSIFIAAPEAAREGLFKAFTLEKKDSTPPPFVPASAIKFQRVRLDLQKTWASLMEMAAKIDPGFAGILQFAISTVNAAGKEKDPNFDFAQSVIANLGDDIITYEKAPKADTAEALQSPPSIFLISSPKATQLADAIRALTTLMPQGGGESTLKETEFLGRKIYSYTTALPEGVEIPGGASSINFTASEGYVAVSSDRSMVEEFLRSGDAGAKPLRAANGFTELAQKVNGANSGFLGYENQTESMRHFFEILKKDKNGLKTFFGQSALPGAEAPEAGEDAGILSWFDTTLLPGYDAISKYFVPAAYSINSSPEGYRVEYFSPRPAQLGQ
jgi:hypothetical protein